MTDTEKLVELHKLLERLLWAYGIRTPLWDEVRGIVDRERPILGNKKETF